jgi:hypothetical protein
MWLLRMQVRFAWTWGPRISVASGWYPGVAVLGASASGTHHCHPSSNLNLAKRLVVDGFGEDLILLDSLLQSIMLWKVSGVKGVKSEKRSALVCFYCCSSSTWNLDKASSHIFLLCPSRWIAHGNRDQKRKPLSIIRQDRPFWFSHAYIMRAGILVVDGTVCKSVVS